MGGQAGLGVGLVTRGLSLRQRSLQGLSLCGRSLCGPTDLRPPTSDLRGQEPAASRAAC